MKATCLVCTLKRSPEESNSEALAQVVLDALRDEGVETDVIRLADHQIDFGVVSEAVTDGDEWPGIRDRILASEILVMAIPTWLGQPRVPRPGRCCTLKVDRERARALSRRAPCSMMRPMSGPEGHEPRGQFFRANVGIAVLNASGEVLAFEREGYPGSWQLPQGGLDAGEEPIDAARRELGEETGIRWDQVQLLGEHPEWLAYELDVDKRQADSGRGQVQKWFYVRLVDPGTAIDVSRVDARKGTREFSAYAWMSFAELLGKTVQFRLGVYRHVAEYARTLGAA